MVPEVMPKVALPEVPLVVEARKCAGVPRWPSNSMLPQPQSGPPGAWAMALRDATVKRVPRRIRFIAVFSFMCVPMDRSSEAKLASVGRLLVQPRRVEFRHDPPDLCSFA
ncbi:hypothetical protein D3C78_1428210 [compost metagenome]